MTRLKIAATVLLCVFLASDVDAQFGVAWTKTPNVVVIAGVGDPRLGLVDEAVAFWNRTLEEIGSGFRLGPVTVTRRPVSEESLQSFSQSIVGSQGRAQVPQALRGLPGDLTVVLADSDFVSFAGPFDPDGKRFVAIKGTRFAPMNLPNVARNVIAHELGHAIGLGHNSDRSKLMCGRPAPCRPDAFYSTEPRMFPLTDDEKHRLISMYPSDWKPR